MEISNFAPSGTTSIAASTGAASVRLKSANPPSVMVFNAGEVIAFIRAGKPDVAATTGDFPVPAGAVMTLDLTASGAGAGAVSHVSAITGSSTATVYLTVGSGS